MISCGWFAASPLRLLGQSGTPDTYIFDSDPETRNPIAIRESDLMWVVCCVALGLLGQSGTPDTYNFFGHIAKLELQAPLILKPEVILICRAFSP